MDGLTTILFDLDGTLLPMDLEKFQELYFKSLSMEFSDLIDPRKLGGLVWECTLEMVSDKSRRTNREVFMEAMGRRVGNELLPEYERRFMEYYGSNFEYVKESTYASEPMREAVAFLRDNGYTLAIATNPVFPEAAVLRRIEWAGLSRDDFELVTTFDNSHYCKPNLEYYEEILKILGKSAEECMMVGNDELEDMVPKKLGMRTYLVTDNMVPGNMKGPEPDYRGSSFDFLGFIKSGVLKSRS
ncbi:HAD family hydrolase [Youngiibacter multivorans]|uniref:FMN phosphatase YigB (HAD superfamily) n=1 Tax=Youngiibacter multivorans TaxID=937251 RepID=A0ABS4G1R5_9CLOT|nr:HAD family hydrolase [Youngiibacter multivorans]MBP1918480.1 FMN phosphatase YigB (HAD superfamily) [Youngiibacter multivorans]